MIKSQIQKKINLINLSAGAVFLGIVMFLGSVNVLANHPVFVEGNCLIPPAGSNPFPFPGTCGDYDGDGVIGMDEDMDGDRVFGTIVGAKNAMNGILNNGTITIVTSGVFAESGIILQGNVTLQAAPGVEAIIDAVLQGDPGSAGRQSGNGIFIDAPMTRRVSLRNITIKNYAVGIYIVGASRVTLENVRLENNVFYGIRAGGSSVMSVMNSSISSTGYRLNPATGDFPTTSSPSPGYGVRVESSARASIVSSVISNNFGSAINSASSGTVCISQSNVIGNGSLMNGPGTINISDNGCYQ